MNCLWEVMLKAKEQGVPEKNIRFQVSRAFSPYMEVSMPEPGHAGGHSCNRGQSILSVL